MAERKPKTRNEPNHHIKLKTKGRQIVVAPTKTSKRKNKINERDGKKKKKSGTGPRLPSRLIKEVESRNSDVADGEDEEIDSDFEANDVYEYEEGVPEEESRKNKRFDAVDNFEYELPEDFKDEDVPSDEDVEGSDDGDDDDDVGEDEDDGRHERMLQGITNLPIEAFQGKKKKNDAVVSEAYPESEYNPSRDVLDGDSHITVDDLLNPLHGTTGFSKIRKRTRELDRKSISVQTPLSKPERDKADRFGTYGYVKKDITKWEPLVKKNREAATISFKGDVESGVSTVGKITSEFQPRTDFEMKMKALVNDKRVVEAHAMDGAKLLEMNKISVEEVKRNIDHRAKLRNLLFLHEIKAKIRKKIKSKTFHRLLKKDKEKSASGEMHMDPEAAKEGAKKQEFKRAEERLTLKHRNKSKWAKRILERGLSTQDEGTRAAIAEQLHEHERLKRKMHSMNDGSSSSDDSSNDDDDGDDDATIIEKANAEMEKLLAKEDKDPKGLLSFPFMVRAAEKARKNALEEHDLFVEQLKGKNGTDEKASIVSSGRRTFGATKKEAPKSVTRTKPEYDYGSSGEEEGIMVKEHLSMINRGSKDSQKDADIDANLFREKSEIDHDHLFKSFDEVVANPGPKTTYDVGILAPDAKKKMIKNKSKENRNTKSSSKAIQNAPPIQDLEEANEDSDSESEGQMVDGMLTATTQPAYELPSHDESLRRAFAGDDVEDEFDKDKQAILNEEIPEPEKPVELPGWGSWPDEQRKRGLPSWMVRNYNDAKKSREEALKGRKDAHMKRVIISEKPDKKAEKLQTKALPYPHTNNDVFEQSIRMPIGPDFNPASKMAALIRPAVVKTTGLNIAPIQFKDVNPHERTEDHKHRPEKGKQNTNKRKSGGAKIQKTAPKKLKAGH